MIVRNCLISILLFFIAGLNACANIDNAAPFYAALLLEKEHPDDERITQFLETALKDPVTHNDAAKKLIGFSPDIYYEKNAKDPSIAAGTNWGLAFDLIKKIEDANGLSGEKKSINQETIDFFLDEKPDSAREWAFSRVKQLADDDPAANILENWELAAIRGHFFVAKSSYSEAKKQFDITLKENERLILSKKELITDLGKTFVYSGSAKTGTELFLRWEDELKSLSLSNETNNGDRYLLLYYAGRMNRQLRNYKAATENFDAAMGIAPDFLQKDACAWYILDMAWTESRAKAIAAVEKYGGEWTDKTYFADLFERISVYYTNRKRWEGLAYFFPCVQKYADGATIAKYAYLLGRTLYFGLISVEDAAAALGLPKGSGAGPEDFYKIAYTNDDFDDLILPPFYYSSLAAERLSKKKEFNLPKAPPAETSSKQSKDKKKDSKTTPSQAFQFIDGFFKYGCAVNAYTYIKLMQEQFSTEELRGFAENLANNACWGDSIRLSILYMNRPGYTLTRRDLEIRYPRAFQEIVERFSEETGMDIFLLYALIRTESICIPDIVSHAGASGLTQLMPETGAEMARQLSRDGIANYIKFGKVDLFNPEVNIHLGAAYYKQLEGRMKNRLLALLAYNGGITRVSRWRRNSTLSDDLFLETIELTETRDYGKKVLADEIVYNFLYGM
ncbi:hypothetical protein AGMMS50212_01110 [Spirochaetia bacterium]|nr:hypothetical protein AGMMS50212_01110 [Spirochaetia bacterium]